jgi:Putative restriction endonuclease
LIESKAMTVILHTPLQDIAINLWRSVIDNPAFRNLPYKVETTRSGAIMMSPASNWHGYTQYQTGKLLEKGRPGGTVLTECSILTTEGVKVADVVWASEAFIAKNGFTTPYLEAPEICVEVRSPGNTEQEITNKVNLYLANGALEVWVIGQDSGTQYYNKMGQLSASALVG